jgi:hypothetical protein
MVRQLIVSSDEVLVALLLFVGLYLPCSFAGEWSGTLFWLNRALSLGLLLYLVWRHGTRANAISFVSLPIIIVTSICTLLHSLFRFSWGVFAAFSLVALLLALDLRSVRTGRFVSACFIIANTLNVACGLAILAGNDWVGQFLTNSYSQFYPEMMPAMLALHKPVLTFADHSVAAFFIYLFFWLNWETYKSTRSKLAVCFALAELLLLIGAASFTSLFFSVVALVQIGGWLWAYSRKAFAVAVLFFVTVVTTGARFLNVEVDAFEELRVGGAVVLSSAISGPLARYGASGNVRSATANFLAMHPLSPIGFAPPISTDVIDSGTLEYVLRGSVPLLVLVYLGLYQFLRHNLPSRIHVLTLFFSIVVFETGFSLLIYYRTVLLLAFAVIWLERLGTVAEGTPLVADSGSRSSLVGNPAMCRQSSCLHRSTSL